MALAGLRWSVFFTTLAFAVTLEDRPMLEAKFATSSTPRTPLAEAIAKIAPPKGMALALAKSLLNDFGDELRESADLDHSWADNDEWLGITHLRRTLVDQIKALTPKNYRDEPHPFWADQGDSPASLDSFDSFDPMEGLSQMDDFREGPEHEVGAALSKLLPDGYSFSTEGASDDASFESFIEDSDSQVFLQMESSPSKLTVFDLKLAAKESLRMAEITGSAKEFERGEIDEQQADIEQERVKSAKHQEKVVQMELRMDRSQLQVETEKRTLQRRVEGRMQSEHLEQLRQAASDAKHTAYDAQMKAAREMELWVQNQPGVNRASVDRVDGVSKFSATKARNLDEAYKIAKADAKKNPIYGDSRSANQAAAPGVPCTNATHVTQRVATQEEDKAVHKAKKALTQALLFDDGYKSAADVAKIADAYIKTSKQILGHKVETATDNVEKSKVAAELAFDEAIVHNTPAHLQRLKNAILKHRFLEAEAEKNTDEMRHASAHIVKVSEHEHVLEAKDKADSLEKRANKVAQNAYQRATESGKPADLAHAKELGEQLKKREDYAQEALKRADSEELADLRRNAVKAETNAAASVTRFDGAKRDLRNAAHRILSARRQREQLAMDQTNLAAQIVDVRKKLANADYSKDVLKRKVSQAEKDRMKIETSLRVAQIELKQSSEQIQTEKSKRSKIEQQLLHAREDYKAFQDNITKTEQQAKPKPTDEASLNQFFDDSHSLKGKLQKLKLQKQSGAPPSGITPPKKKLSKAENAKRQKALEIIEGLSEIRKSDNVKREVQTNKKVQAKVAEAAKLLNISVTSLSPKKEKMSYVDQVFLEKDAKQKMTVSQAQQRVTKIDAAINATRKRYAEQEDQQETKHALKYVLADKYPLNNVTVKQMQSSTSQAEGGNGVAQADVQPEEINQTGHQAQKSTKAPQQQDAVNNTSNPTTATSGGGDEAVAAKAEAAEAEEDGNQAEQPSKAKIVEVNPFRDTMQDENTADEKQKIITRVKDQLEDNNEALVAQQKRQVRFQDVLRRATEKVERLKKRRKAFAQSLRKLMGKTKVMQKDFKVWQTKESSIEEKLQVVHGVIKIAKEYAHDLKRRYKTMNLRTKKVVKETQRAKQLLRTTAKALRAKEAQSDD